MRVLILFDHQVCHLNSISNRCATLQVDPTIFPSARSTQSLLNVICFIRPKLPFFFPPFSFKDSDFLIKYPSYGCEVSSFFPSMFLPGGSHEDALQVYHLSLSFFPGGFKSSFVDHAPFPLLKCFLLPVHLLIFHLSLFNCSGVLKISQKIQV